ncbi:MAG: hypothetical protein RBU30_01405 [Polyangia bacterium]|jgi:hypothetical protein|nr:hypothetical protein [Polyangia bacterium]
MYRPSGLTALAVFNFVLAGWGLLKLLGVAIVLAAGTPKGAQGQPPPQFLMLLTLGYLIFDIGLMVTAGIGYLKLKRFLGRWVGSIEAVVSLAYFVAVVAYVQSEGIPFDVRNLSALVYPGLTLVLLNIVFRENLVH